MTTDAGTLISPDQIDAVLDRARAERWTGLVLVGSMPLGFVPQPAAVAAGHRVFRLLGRVDGLTAKLRPLTSLTALGLPHLRLRDEDIAELSPLAGLTSLDLSNNDLTDGGMRALSALANLTTLDLSRNRIADDGARALAPLRGLTSLALSANRITGEGARAIAALTRLTALDLNNNRITDEGARAVSTLPALATLELRSNKITDEGARAIAGRTTLTSLVLSNNRITDEGVRAIAGLARLTSLGIGSVAATEDGLHALAALGGLTALKLGFTFVDAAGIRAIAALKTLTSLDLPYTLAAEEDVSAIGDLAELVSLDLAGNGLTAKGAHAIAGLANLTSLDLATNRIGDEGAQAIGSLGKLTTLDLGSNRIGKQGAQAIAKLAALASLDIDSNAVGNEGARALAALPRLGTLNLAFNGITDEGARAIAAARNLTSLNLNTNSITDEGAGALAALTGLTELKLSYNKITDAGVRALVALANLVRLDLSGNAITGEGARAVGQLTNLVSLDLGGNAIGDEGARAIAPLSNLVSLWADNAQVADEGARAISALTNLTWLHLRQNSITDTGVRHFAALDRLTWLRLARNQIADGAARTIAALADLTTLDLSNNAIGGGGARALAGLAELTSLELANNRVGDDGVRAVAALANLTRLDLANNDVGDEGARALAALANLTQLNLADNRIGDDGARAVAALAKLARLELARNRIADVGAGAIAALASLHDLDLSDNAIGEAGATALLMAWDDRPDLRYRRIAPKLKLKGNELADWILPAEVIESGDARALLAAYRRYRSGDEQKTLRPLNEAKLLIVGNEAVGKTSLVRYLVDNEPRREKEEKTPGVALHEKINVKQWSPASSEITLNIWDFGGQEVMHGTHRYFLSKRSLYLLVLEDRREDDVSVYDWLKTIKSRGADSPVIVVVNKSDEGKDGLQLDETSLKREHPSIVDILRTSCNEGPWAARSIAALRARIVQTLLEHEQLREIRDSVPPNWLRIKHAVQDLAKKGGVLPAVDFQRLCETPPPNAAPGDEPITDPNEQRALLGALDRLGAVVAFGLTDDSPAALSRFSLLDPNWLTQAIYATLNARKVRDQNGVFAASQLGEWLDPAIYPPSRHELILGMMQDEEIGLCFELPDAKGQFLIPEALPASEPFYGNWPQDSLRFRYRYDLLPRRLLPQFIVQVHASLANPPTCWRTGAVIQASGCNVLVRGDRGSRTVDILVDGPVGLKRAALAIVLDRLEKIHRRNPEIGTEALVPLPDQPGLAVEYEHLLTLERRYGPDHKFDPKGAERQYPVRELLDGVRRTPGPSDSIPPPVAVPAEPFWASVLASWPFFSLACGVSAAAVLLLVMALPPEWRTWVAWPAAAGAAVTVVLLFLNPATFYRRLAAGVIAVGMGIAAAGFTLDLYADGAGWFRWSRENGIGFYIAWVTIAGMLILADIKQKRA